MDAIYGVSYWCLSSAMQGATVNGSEARAAGRLSSRSDQRTQCSECGITWMCKQCVTLDSNMIGLPKSRVITRWGASFDSNWSEGVCCTTVTRGASFDSNWSEV